MSVFVRQVDDDLSTLHEQLIDAKERARELVRADQALRKTIEAIAEDADLSSVVGKVLVTAGEQLEAPVVEYWIHDSDTVARLVMSCREGQVYSGSDLPNDPRVAGITIPYSTTGADSLFKLRGHFVSDLANDPEQHAVFDPLGLDLGAWCLDRDVTTHLNVQLRFGDRSLGSLVVYFRSDQVLTDARIELAYALANQITLAIRLTELSEQTQATALERARAQAAQERSEALATVNSVLTSSLSRLSGASDMREFLAHVLAEILRVTGASNVAVTRYHAGSNQLQLELFHDGRVPRWGLSGNELALWASPYDADITPAFQIGLSHRHIFVASMMKDQTEIPISEFALPGGMEWMTAIGASDAAVSILFAGDQPVGTFHLHFTGGRTLRPDDLPLLNALSQQAAIALRLVTLSDQAQHAAIAREREMEAELRAKEASRISNFLNATLGQMSESADLQLTIESIITGLAREIGAGHVFLFRHDATACSIRLELSCIEGRIRHGLSGEELPLFAAPFPDDITPAWRNMMEMRGLFTPEMTPIPAPEFAWPGAYQYANRFGISDMGHIVLFAGDDSVGSIGFCLADGRKLKTSDKAFIEGVAKQAALAIRMLDLAEQAKQAAVAATKQKAAQERAAELSRANAVLMSSVEAVANSADPKMLLENFLLEAMRAAGAKGGAFTLYENGHFKDIVCLAQFGELVSEAVWRREPFIIETPQVLGANIGVFFARLMQEKITRDGLSDAWNWWPAAAEYHQRSGHIEVWNVACIARGQVIASFSLGFAVVPDIHSVESMLIALAQQAALALELHRLSDEAKQKAILHEQERAAQDRATELAKANEALRSLNAKLTSDMDLKQFLGFVLVEAARSLDADAGAVFLLDSNGDLIPAQWWEAGQTSDHIRDYPYSAERPIRACDWPLWHRLCTERVARVVKMEEFYGDAQSWHTSRGHARVVVAPLLLGNEPLGFLGLAHTGAAEIADTTLQLVSALAEQTTLAVQLTHLATNAQMQAVSREQERATTEERSRLAREIHDTMAQSFSGIIVQLRAMQRVSAGAEDGTTRQMHADNALELASSGLAEARRSLTSLRLTELEGRSLREALTLMAQSTTKRSGIPVRVEATNDFDFGIENEPELLRIAQESVTNSVKHSGASQIVIALRREGSRCDLCIEDNGRGFDLGKATEGFGLIGMQERADRIGAIISIETNDAGTAVCVHLQRGDPHAQ